MWSVWVNSNHLQNVLRKHFKLYTYRQGFENRLFFCDVRSKIYLKNIFTNVSARTARSRSSL